MADSDKLWFELGVRDEVTGTLEKLIGKANELQQAMTISIKDKNGPHFKEAYENAVQLESVLIGVNRAVRNIDEAMKRASETGRDTSGLEKMRNRVLEVKDAFDNLFEQIKASPDAMRQGGLVDALVKKENVDLMLQQVKKITGEEIKMADDVAKAKIAAQKDVAEWASRLIEDEKRANKEMTDEKLRDEKKIQEAALAGEVARAKQYDQQLKLAEEAVRRSHEAFAQQNYDDKQQKREQELLRLREAIIKRYEEEAAAAERNTQRQNANNQARQQAVQKTREQAEALVKNRREFLELQRQQLQGLLSQGKDALGAERYDQVKNALRGVRQELREIDNVMRNMGSYSIQDLFGLGRNSQNYTPLVTDTNRMLNENRQRQAQAAEAALENARANKGLADSYEKVVASGKHTNAVLDQLKVQLASMASLYAIEGLLKSVVQVGGEFEVQHIALQSILGDIQQANSMFEQMKELAVVSPFNFRDLAKYSKQVAAFGIPYEEMYDTTKRLADMSAGLGVDMSRLILAYGQVRSAAVLRGQELRQFTEAGIPMVKALADEFTRLNGRAVSTAEVFELISKRAVPFEMVKKVMWDMTNEGGRFYDMQFVLSDTLAGKWSNLQDAWEIMLSEFARGESITGKFLKSTVSFLTWTVESVNALTPLIATVMSSMLAVKTVKWVQGMGNLGFNAIDQNIAKAQQLRAIELTRSKINGEITAKQYAQGMRMNAQKSNYYQVLAMEGRLNAYQIQRVYQQGNLNKKQLTYLQLMGLITKEQRQQIINGTLQNTLMSRLGGLGSKMFAAVGGWFGIGAIALDALIVGVSTYLMRLDEAKQKNAELGEGFINKTKEIRESIASLSESTPTDDEEYKRGIDGLKEMIKQHSANYDAIIRETNAIKTLEGQYEHLKTALQKQNEISQEAEARAEKFGKKVRSTFEKANEYARVKTTGRQSFWDALFGMDTDIDRGLNKTIKTLRDKISEVIPDIGKSERANELYRQLRNSIEEQLGIGSREKMLINIKLNELFNIDNVEDATTLVLDKFSEMISKVEPQIANKIRYSQPLNQAEKDKVAELVNDAANETKSRYPYYESTLQNLLNNSNFVANIQLRFSTSGTQVNDLQRFIYGNFPSIIADEKIKNIATNWASTGSMYDARNSAKGDIDKAYNELVSRKSTLKQLQDAAVQNTEQIDKAQDLVDKANARYTELKDAALYGLGYDYEGEKKKSNKEPKSGSKKDSELEALKNRIDLYKKFYQELKGYQDIYGKSKALEILKNDGEFGAVFKFKKAFNLTDLSDYKQTLDELTRGFNANTEARSKLINSTKADIENKQRKDAVEGIKEYVSELKKMMSVMSENYQTYRKWVDLTGDANLAARAAGVTQNGSYNSYLKEQMITELAKNKNYSALTPEDVFNMSDKDVRQFGKDSGIVAIYEEWRKHQQMLKKEQWELYEEAIKDAKDYDDKIADINRNLEKQIAALEALGASDDILQSARQNAADKVSELEWEKFKKESDWGRVFGDLDNMSLTSIKKMVDAMKTFQKETRLSEKETRAWQKAMKDLTDKKISLDPINAITDAIKKFNTAVAERNNAQKDKQSADDRLAAIRGEVVTNPQSAENRQKRLEKAVKDQEAANKRLVKSEDNVTEAFNELKKAAAAIGNSFKNLGSSLSSLGSSIGGQIGDVIGGFGSMFSHLGDGISAIKDMDWNAKGITGLFGKVSTVLTVVNAMVDMNKALADILPTTESIYQKHAEEQKHINQLREAIDSYRVAVAKARAEEVGWMGSDPLKELQDAYKIHGEIVNEYYNKLYEAQEAYVESSAGIKDAIIPLVTAVAAVAGIFTAGAGTAVVEGFWAAIAATIGSATIGAAVGGSIAAGVGYAVGQAIQSGIDSIVYKEGQVDARSNMKVQTRHRTLFRSERTQNLEEWTKENLGVDLFDKSGLIDLKAAQAVLDSGITLVGETEETLKRLMELREQYDEWEKSIKDYISNSFGGLADNLTDAIWDWLDGGKSALDSFKDYASDTFKKIAQDAVKTFLKTTVLDQFEEQLESLYKAYSMKDNNGNRVINEAQLMVAVASLAGDMAAAFEAILPTAEALAQTIANAFDYQGYDIVGDGSGNNSATNSIKNISETTGDLLASYVNAMRADMSANRAMVALYYPQFLSSMERGNVIADAQLVQLRTIVENTRRNTEFVERIYNILHGVAPDGTKVQIK